VTAQISGAQALAAIVANLAQPETCTCGVTTPNAVGMEAHLRDVHGMDGTAYPSHPECLDCPGRACECLYVCQVCGARQVGAPNHPNGLCPDTGARVHEVVPATGDFFALQTTCQAPACGQRAYWRIGTAVWEHASEATE
jgi:hypothetical protein